MADNPTQFEQWLSTISASDIAQLIESGSIIIATLIAIGGVRSWMREAKWKRKFELAEEVLSSLYEVDEAIKYMRFPGSYANEGKSRTKKENETPDETNALDMAYVVFERYEKNRESFIKLKSMKYRFMAVFGKEYKEHFEGIDGVVGDIFRAANRLGYEIWPKFGKTHNEAYQKVLLDMLEKEEKIFWENGLVEGGDEVTQTVQRHIGAIEKICSEITSKRK